MKRITKLTFSVAGDASVDGRRAGEVEAGARSHPSFHVGGGIAGLFFLLAAIWLAPSVWAQPQLEFEWLRQYGTIGKANEFVNAVATDGGNIYVTGATLGNLDGGNQGGNDIFVRKYSSFGTLLNSTQLGTALDDIAFAIFVDATGVYIGGTTLGNFSGTGSAGSNDALVLRLNLDLTGPTWKRQFGSPGTDSIRAITGDSSFVYVAGGASGALPGEGGEGTLGGTDAFLAKFSTDGTQVWTRRFGTTAFDQANGVGLDTTGVYVAGATQGALAPAQFQHQGNNDGFVRKYQPDGIHVWTRQFGTAGSEVVAALSANAAAIAAGGGIYAAGTDLSAGTGQAFVKRLNPDDGTDLWPNEGRFRHPTDSLLPLDNFGAALVFGTSLRDGAQAVFASWSTIIVAGFTLGALFPDNDGNAPANQGDNDVFVASFNADDGILNWGRQIGSPFPDLANGVIANATDVVITGVAQGLLPNTDTFDPDTIGGGEDGFVRKLNVGDGRKIWATQFGSLGAVPDFARAVVLAGGRVAAAGEVGAGLPGEIHLGLSDAYLRTFDLNSGAFDGGGQGTTTTQVGTVGNDIARGAYVDPDRGIYIVGVTGGTLPNQTGPPKGLGGPNDAFVARFNFNGVLEKLTQFGIDVPDNNFDTAAGVSGDATGIYLVGTKGVGSLQDVFVRKFDFDLTTTMFSVLIQSFTDAAVPASAGADIGNGISAGPNGVYVVGQIGGNLPSSQLPDLPSATPTFDGFVQRLHPTSGGVLAPFGTRLIRTNLVDNAFAVTQDPTGVYVAGFVGGALVGQPPVKGPNDAFVRKFDFNGNVLQTRVIQSDQGDIAFTVAADGLGVYVAGRAEANLPGQSPAGGADAFVAKYTTDLDQLWTFQFGSSKDDAALGISAGSLGVFAAGSTTGTLLGQTSAGADDAFVGSLVTKVTINIRPGSDDNSINLRSSGTLPVAILSSAGFDARTVQPTTVTLANAPVESRPGASLEDVNRDGLLDLVVHVRTAALQLTSSDTQAILRGRTLTGDHIRGVDTIRLVP